MTDTQPDGDVIQEFIRGIARKTIADLVVAAITDDAFISKLCAVDLVPDEVAAFAKAKGFFLLCRRADSVRRRSDSPRNSGR